MDFYKIKLSEFVIEFQKDSILTKNEILLMNKVISDYYLTTSTLDIFYICHDAIDTKLVEIMNNTFDLEQRSKITDSSFDKALSAITLIYQNQALRKQEISNNILYWISISSIIGTITGLISFIDFDNNLFNIIFRIALLTSSIVIMGLLFIYLTRKDK